MSENVKWVSDEELEALTGKDGNPSRNEVIAQSLRENPNMWAAVDLPLSYGSMIRAGLLVAFRPSEDYEARVIKGELYVRYIGNGEPVPVDWDTIDRRTRYDHAEVRRELRDKVLAGEFPETWRAGWPRTYTTKIKHGLLGYTPRGAYDARFDKKTGVHVWLTSAGKEAVGAGAAAEGGTSVEVASAPAATATPTSAAEAPAVVVPEASPVAVAAGTYEAVVKTPGWWKAFTEEELARMSLETKDEIPSNVGGVWCNGKHFEESIEQIMARGKQENWTPPPIVQLSEEEYRKIMEQYPDEDEDADEAESGSGDA